MKTSAWTYILYYLLVFIILSIIYGIVQKHYICIEMEGFECNFNETKFVGFLTIVAYIITPVVAIFGFMSWKEQYKYQNQKERFTKIFESALHFNNEIKLLRSREIAVRSINNNESQADYQENYLNKIYENYLNRIDNLKRLGEECLSHICILEFSLNKK